MNHPFIRLPVYITFFCSPLFIAVRARFCRYFRPFNPHLPPLQCKFCANSLWMIVAKFCSFLLLLLPTSGLTAKGVFYRLFAACRLSVISSTFFSLLQFTTLLLWLSVPVAQLSTTSTLPLRWRSMRRCMAHPYFVVVYLPADWGSKQCQQQPDAADWNSFNEIFALLLKELHPTAAHFNAVLLLYSLLSIR